MVPPIKRVSRQDGADPLTLPPLPEPNSWMIVSGPSSSIASRVASAISLKASSQVMRCHLPSPRSPLRLSGYFSRSAPYMTWLKHDPF